jgi:hypothetical protein
VSKLSTGLQSLISRAGAPFRPAVVVGGLGRCGTTVVYHAVLNSSRIYTISDTFVVDLSGFTFRNGTVYKTHDFPPSQLQRGVKVIFMFGNPMNAAISARREFNGEGRGHYKHVHSPHETDHELMFEKDVLLMEEHFDQWMQTQAFSFLSIRYENLFDDEVGELLSDYIGHRITLPTKAVRRSEWLDHPASDALAKTYGRLAEKVLAAPKVKLWPDSSKVG